ncbi:MAG: hypothetical protein HKP30_13910, partial [Myxococcales bacterium]|nr:hypothetical protein [Myxococcales bacterium]
MSLPIPLSPEDVTAEWLSQVLSKRWPGVRVAGVDLLDAHAGTTGRARIGVRYAGEPRGPDSLFIKLPPFDAAGREWVQSTGMGRREARFYAELAAELPVRLPQPYFAAFDESGAEYIMVLEDLAANGCSFPRPDDPGADERARSVVEG